jgi:membrane protease YdiL (CAAX protease family)
MDLRKTHLFTLGVFSAHLSYIALLLKFSPGMPATTFYFADLGVTYIAIAVILKIKWGQNINRPTISPLASILFVLGALSLGLILKGAWYELLQSMASEPQKYVDPMLYKEAPAQKSLFQNIWTMLLAPLNEEILYRFGLLSSLSFFVKRPLALVLSAAVFATAHFWVYPASMMIPLFVTGLILGVVYLTLGLRWSMLLHIIFNSKPLIDSTLLSNETTFTVFFALAFVGIWVFISKSFKVRRAVFDLQ